MAKKRTARRTKEPKATEEVTEADFFVDGVSQEDKEVIDEPKAKKEEHRDDDLRGKKAMGWFLTYPNCDLSKEFMLKLLDERMKAQNYQIKEYVIAEEIAPSTNKPHLHCFIKINKTARWTTDRFRVKDEKGREFQPNCQVAKSWVAVKQYCAKEGNYIANIDLKSAAAKKGKLLKSDLLRPVNELLDEGKLTPLQVANFYKNQCVYRMLTNNDREMPDNLDEMEKRRHLWIYGATNSGKTYWLRKWIRERGEKNCFQIPYNNDWVGYVDQKYLYADEYRGQLSVTDINRICDGGAKMNIKGTTVQLRWDVEVVLVSNYPIKTCYDKVDDIAIASLKSRFIEQKFIYDAKTDNYYQEIVPGTDIAKLYAQKKDAQEKDKKKEEEDIDAMIDVLESQNK